MSDRDGKVLRSSQALAAPLPTEDSAAVDGTVTWVEVPADVTRSRHE